MSTSIQEEGYHLFDQEDIDFLERLSQIDPDRMTQEDIDSLARLSQIDPIRLTQEDRDSLARLLLIME